MNASELLPLVASGIRFKDGIALKSGQMRNDIDHQPERTAARNSFTYLLTVARISTVHLLGLRYFFVTQAENRAGIG
jgi:hypothetical protein